MCSIWETWNGIKELMNVLNVPSSLSLNWTFCFILGKVVSAVDKLLVHFGMRIMKIKETYIKGLNSAWSQIS